MAEGGVAIGVCVSEKGRFSDAGDGTPRTMTTPIGPGLRKLQKVLRSSGLSDAHCERLAGLYPDGDFAALVSALESVDPAHHRPMPEILIGTGPGTGPRAACAEIAKIEHVKRQPQRPTFER